MYVALSIARPIASHFVHGDEREQVRTGQRTRAPGLRGAAGLLKWVWCAAGIIPRGRT